MKKIREFSFHKDMSRKGKLHAEKERDLAMMNKIWSSPIICTKCPHIREYLEAMRIEGILTSSQLYFIEKYIRSIKPFSTKKKVYEYQISLLLSEKEPREQILFKEVEIKGISGKPPSAA